MSNILLIARLTLGLIPTLWDLVKHLEREVDVAGQGQSKAEALRLFVVEAFKVIPDEAKAGISADKLTLFVSAVATIIVNLFKKTGMWK